MAARHWQQPYPTVDMERFAALFARGEELGLSVVFGLAPARLLGWNNVSRLGDRDGDGIGDVGQQALAAKLLSLQRVGARRFALLFDENGDGVISVNEFHKFCMFVTLASYLEYQSGLDDDASDAFNQGGYDQDVADGDDLLAEMIEMDEQDRSEIDRLLDEIKSDKSAIESNLDKIPEDVVS